MAHYLVSDELQIDYSSMPRSSEEAIKKGQKFYFDGKPCRWQKHLCPRYAKIRKCVRCIAEAAVRWADKDREHFRRLARAGHARNAKQRQAEARARYHADVDASRAKALAEYYKNPERYKERHRQYRLRNVEKERLRARERRQKHKEKISAYNKKYKAENRALYAACEKARYAKKMSAMPDWVDSAAMASIYAEARQATIDTGIKHEVDHIVPLQGRGVCGLHVPWNLQVLTKIENVRKSNRLIEEHQCGLK